MAQSDFNENDYQNRQAGLTAWLNGAGNATPAAPAYPDQTQPTITPMQAFIAGQVAQQSKAAQNAGFDTSDVNSGATTAAPPTSDLSTIEPNQKAAALAQEAFAPGTQNAIPAPAPPAGPSTPFANTTTGAILGAMMPHTFGAANSMSRGKALTDYIQSIPSDNDPTIAAIQGMAKQDPANGEKYAGALSQYMAQNQTPIARTQAEEANMNLAAEKFKLHQLQGGMAAAAADAPPSATPNIQGMPQSGMDSIPPIAAITPGQPRDIPRGSLKASEKGIVTPPQEAGITTNGTVGGMPLSGAANTALANYLNSTKEEVAPASQKVTSNAPMSPQEQHVELLRQQAAAGLIPYSEYVKAKDPTNAENQPKYTDHNGVVYEQKPGEKPTPYSIPAAIKTDAQGNPIATAGTGGAPGTTGAPSQASNFGFKLPAMTQQEIKIQQENDKAAQLAAQSNIPIIRNAQRYLDALEPSLKDLHTGTGSTPFQYMNSMANGILPAGISPDRMQKMNTEYGNINSNTQSLALELSKLQPGQGSKGNKLSLQTLINSKPGFQNDNQSNMNTLADMRAKLSDIETSADLDQQYRAASPYGTTDANTRALDDALKTIYPLQTVDKKTGNVTFNQHNADLIRKIIPDAIKRPDGYLKQAQLQGGPISYDPTEAGGKTAQNPTTMKTPSGIPYTVVQ